jgi:hypothetical protein
MCSTGVTGVVLRKEPVSAGEETKSQDESEEDHEKDNISSDGADEVHQAK